MNELHTDPLTADVVTSEATSSTSYGNLTTSGPAVTKTLVNGQKVLVIISARIESSAAVSEAFMSFAVSGATSLASSDSNACRQVNTSGDGTCTRMTVFTATAGGSHTFTCQYKVSTGSTTGTFRERRIIIKPF